MEKIKFPDDTPKELFEKSTLIPTWLKNMSPEIELIEGRIIKFDLFLGPRIGFIEMDCDYKYKGKQYNERFFLLGRSVYITVLYKTEDSQLYTILVKQPRIGCGELVFEYPAGMVDDSTDYNGTAVRELEEECGIIAKEEELIEISDFMYSSQTSSDDNAKVYLIIRNETLENIMKMQNQTFGADEDEVITLQVTKFDDVLKLTKDLITTTTTLHIQELIKNGKLRI